MSKDDETRSDKLRKSALARTMQRLTGGKTLPVAEGPLSGLNPGVLVDGRYRVIEKLGQGGMGAVFKVEHVRMGKRMALKLLLRQFAAEKHLVVQFEQEAQIASKLSCPNTVSVFDFGEMPELGLYMAMELVPGRDLDSLLEADGVLSERAAVGIAVQVLYSLAEAHDAGIIHRDIKPANVMLLRTREAKDFVKVLDFGIAKLADVGKGPGISSSGPVQFVGTPEYASPEQARGQSLDARSDLYSLGVMLFELVTGKPPFTDRTPTAVLAKHIAEPVPRLADANATIDVSPRFEEIIRRALAKEPADRYPTADAMRADLEALAARYSDRLVLSPVEELHGTLQVDESIAQRTDWDAFENALRRSARTRRVVGLSLLALAFGGGAVAIGAALRGDRVHVVQEAAFSSEREPNDSPAQANVITAGSPVRGTIGKRLSDSDSDLDFYRFDVASPSRARIEATAVPNVNVALALYASDGAGGFRETAKVDDQPMRSAAPEVMDDLLLSPGSYVVGVRDRRRRDEDGVTRPRENSTDAYVVRVDLSPPDPDAELEPNNTREERDRVIERGHPVFGHTGVFAAREPNAGLVGALWSDDSYVFRLAPDATHACAILIGARDASLHMEVSASGAAAQAGLDQKGHAVASQCVAATDTLAVRVTMNGGADLQDRYVIAVVDDGTDGFWAATHAAQRLEADGRKDDATHLLARAVADLPKAPAASLVRLKLRQP